MWRWQKIIINCRNYILIQAIKSFLYPLSISQPHIVFGRHHKTESLVMAWCYEPIEVSFEVTSSLALCVPAWNPAQQICFILKGTIHLKGSCSLVMKICLVSRSFFFSKVPTFKSFLQGICWCCFHGCTQLKLTSSIFYQKCNIIGALKLQTVQQSSFSPVKVWIIQSKYLKSDLFVPVGAVDAADVAFSRSGTSAINVAHTVTGGSHFYPSYDRCVRTLAKLYFPLSDHRLPKRYPPLIWGWWEVWRCVVYGVVLYVFLVHWCVL